MEKRKFEDGFKDAFNEAEVSPSESVWTNIELELEKESGDTVRRKLFFYKLLAAASITFALVAVGIGIYVNNQSERAYRDLAQRASEVQELSFNRRQETPSPQPEGSGDLAAGVESSSPAAQAGSESSSEFKTFEKADDKKSRFDAPSSGLKDTPLNVPEVSKTGDLADTDTRRQASGRDVGTTPPMIETPSAARNKTHIIASDGAHNKSDNQNSIASEQSDYSNGVADGTLSLNELQQRSLPSLYQLKKETIVIVRPKTDPVAAMMAKLASDEAAYARADEKEQKEEKESKEKIWTSVGFAAGAFNSINPGVGNTPTSSLASYSYTNQSSVPDKQSRASGIAYSLGVSVGTKLARRWVLQSGLNYMTQSSDYTASNVVAQDNYQTLKAESVNSLGTIPQVASAANTSDARLARTAPYNVNNNVRFFSVPVQAGYLLVNKTFGIQLNAGVSSDIFLQNTITPQSGSLSKSTQGSGDDSPYRTLNFSGLVGTEFTYRFGQRYRVSVNPGVRYPLSSVYKSDVGIQSTPVTFDVGLRFRYIFQ